MDNLGALATDDLGTFVDSIGGDVDNVPEETAAAQLDTAAHDFAEAGDRLDSIIVAPLRFVPVLGRQIRSAQALAHAANTTASSGSVAFAELNEELSGTAQSPQARMDTVRTTEKVLTELSQSLSGIDLGPTDKLLPPLANARNRFSDQYNQTVETLDSALITVRGIDAFLSGPNRYLVLASNNAEMRGGSGMFLQVGELSIADGRFEIGDFTPAGQLLSSEPGTTLDADMAHLWGQLSPDREWRNLNLSPRFDESARMASDMWVSAGNQPVDGVISIDVIGLAELLDVIGPVEVDSNGQILEVSPENVAQYLLLDQYEDFQDDRDARRDQLGAVTSAIFDAFNSRSWSASALMQALRRSGEGRHILLWSTDPTQQAAWNELGATGKLQPDSLMVSVLNRGGNKLDQFLDVDAVLSGKSTDGGHRVAVDVTLTNDAPSDLPSYVEGPNPSSGLNAGDYLGLVAITIPAGGGNPTMTGADLAISGDDGPTRVLVGEVLIPAGQSTEVRVEFDLPADWTSIDVEPSARVPAVTWHLGDNQWKDDQAVEVPTSEL